ncbi:MAG: nucleotidyltransferase domain-containing protein [Phycisphaerales bacterium]
MLRDDIIQPYLDSHPWPMLFVTVSGAHLYGFASPDSDYDLRGAHYMPAKSVVGLKLPRETYEVMDLDCEVEMDLVTHDAKKFFEMLLKKNGYVLEQVFSPIVIQSTPEFEELKEIAKKCITRFNHHHFRSFTKGQWDDLRKANKPTVKKLLYAYRPVLAGIHLMTEHEVESNIVKLNERFDLSYLDELVAIKSEGTEKMEAVSLDMGFHEAELTRLLDQLEIESERSTLPENPGGHEELNDLLIRLRFKH